MCHDCYLPRKLFSEPIKTIVIATVLSSKRTGIPISRTLDFSNLPKSFPSPQSNTEIIPQMFKNQSSFLKWLNSDTFSWSFEGNRPIRLRAAEELWMKPNPVLLKIVSVSYKRHCTMLSTYQHNIYDTSGTRFFKLVLNRV